MNVGERIRLIQRLIPLLAELPWEQIDFVLESYGGATHEEWPGTQESYLLESLKSMGDGNLGDLAAFLDGEDQRADAPAATPVQGGPWEPGMFRLFVSHTHPNAAAVLDLKRALAAYGIDAFVAHEDIEHGLPWQAEIESALATCDGLLAYVTPDFSDSEWTDQEVGWCIGRRVPVMSIRMGADPYGFFGQFQAIRGDEPEKARAIVTILLRDATQGPRVARAMVDRFVVSRNFAAAKENVRILGVIPAPYWSDEMLDAVERACEENPQIRGAFYVPGTARTIVSKAREAQIAARGTP